MKIKDHKAERVQQIRSTNRAFNTQVVLLQQTL